MKPSIPHDSQFANGWKCEPDQQRDAATVHLRTNLRARIGSLRALVNISRHDSDVVSFWVSTKAHRTADRAAQLAHPRHLTFGRPTSPRRSCPAGASSNTPVPGRRASETEQLVFGLNVPGTGSPSIAMWASCDSSKQRTPASMPSRTITPRYRPSMSAGGRNSFLASVTHHVARTEPCGICAATSIVSAPRWTSRNFSGRLLHTT